MCMRSKDRAENAHKISPTDQRHITPNAPLTGSWDLRLHRQELEQRPNVQQGKRYGEPCFPSSM